MIYPWQKNQWQYLLQRLQQKSLPHALLFAGIAGMGKVDFALAFAQLLLCQQASENACGHCASCQLFSSQTHPDFLLLQPEENSKTLKIEQIRHLTEQFQHTAHNQGFQVAIVQPAEAMTTGASNALLKTLEEPHANVVIILVSNQVANIPATIRSRCQIVRFGAKQEQAHQWLQSKMDSSEQVRTLLNITQQAPLRALALAEQNYLQQQQQLVENVLALVARQKTPLEIAALYKEEPIQLFLERLQIVFLDTIKVKLRAADKFLSCLEQKTSLRALSEKLSLSAWRHWQQKLTAQQVLIKQNPNLNTQILLENLFIA
jgi:DNA polymerase-3 subunit delta'